MFLGSYYLTMFKDGEPGEGKVFRDVDEAMMAYAENIVTLHAKVKVRVKKQIGGKTIEGLIDTTVGQLIFNRPIPQDLGFVDRSKPENALRLEIEFLVGKSGLGKIIGACIDAHGTAVTAEMLDNIKSQGFKYSTKGAISISISDAVIPPQKKEFIAEAEKTIEKLNELYNEGRINSDERYERVIQRERHHGKGRKGSTDNLDKYIQYPSWRTASPRQQEPDKAASGMRG